MTPSFWAGRSVLVTGHSGFKGSWLSALLLELGAKVHGFSDLPPDPAGPFDLAKHAEPGLHAVTIGDVRDLAAVRRAMDQASPEIVLHLAAQSLVRRSYRDPVTTFTTNVIGTVHVLEAARNCPSVRAVIVVTSDKCYEITGEGRPFREEDRLGGHDPYSSSKACCELVAASFRSSFATDAHPLRIATVRAGNVIGGGDWSADRLIPDLVRAQIDGETVEVRFPDAVRPWQHVLEPLSGYLMLAEAMIGSSRAEFCSAWNFGPADEDCLSVRRIVTQLADVLGVSWRMSSVPAPPETYTLRLDSAKAGTLLGWQPRLRIDRALEWTASWYRNAAAGDKPCALTQDQIRRWRALDVGSPRS